MQIDIRSTNLPLSDAVHGYVASRVEATLTRFTSAVRSVTVTLSDLNGPKGGCDMRCHMEINMQTAPSVVIEERADDLYATVSSAAQRAKAAVLRRVDSSKPHNMRFNSA
jgi:putative sigma-54 modulation protein